MIFVNFKTFKEGTGHGALELVKVLEEVAHLSRVKIIPVVQSTDIKEIVLSSKLEVWAQKIDPVSYGAHTGSILPEAVFEDGAVGTFLNHSEAKLATFAELKQTNQKAKEVGLKTLIFTAGISELNRILALKPTFVAYEPPELVGSRETSVAQAKPEIISEASVLAKNAGIPLIVGAGIHSQEDVKKSLELGAVGVVVASDIVLAEDPKKELLDLVEGFR